MYYEWSKGYLDYKIPYIKPFITFSENVEKNFWVDGYYAKETQNSRFVD